MHGNEKEQPDGPVGKAQSKRGETRRDEAGVPKAKRPTRQAGATDGCVNRLRCAALLRGVNKKKLNKVREERITALHPAAPRKKAGDGGRRDVEAGSGLVC